MVRLRESHAQCVRLESSGNVCILSSLLLKVPNDAINQGCMSLLTRSQLLGWASTSFPELSLERAPVLLAYV